MKQHNRKAPLQRRNLPADGGLAKMQKVAGTGETTGFGNGVKDPQFVPIHAYLQSKNLASSSLKQCLFRGGSNSSTRLGDKFFCLQRCHAACPCRRYRLPVGFVLHIASGKHTGDVGGGAVGMGNDIAFSVCLNLALKNSCIGSVADGNKDALH